MTAPGKTPTPADDTANHANWEAAAANGAAEEKDVASKNGVAVKNSSAANGAAVENGAPQVKPGWLMSALKAPTLSPAGMLVWAAFFAVIYWICGALGLREYTCVLCGTSPSGNPADSYSIAMGVGYVILYFLFVLAAPILMIAAIILRLFSLWTPSGLVEEKEE